MHEATVAERFSSESLDFETNDSPVVFGVSEVHNDGDVVLLPLTRLS
jgi:hypothetical protein